MGKIDRLKAQELRELGLRYDEISKELGCSVAWCKLNLKNVNKNEDQDLIILKLIEVCKRKGYLTLAEVEDMFLNSGIKMITNSGYLKIVLAKIRKIMGFKSRLVKKPSQETNNYIVYSATLNGTTVYIGSGNIGREKHLLSGCSHIYELNKLHFEGILPEVNILKTFKTKEEARHYEQLLIHELNPSFNNKNSVPLSRYSIVLKYKTTC